MQALLGFTSEARWMRHAHQHLGHLFAICPASPAVGGGLHAGGVRPLQGHHPTLRPGRVGAVRLLRLTFPLLLGPAPASGVHAGRTADRVRVDRAKADERQTLLGILRADPSLAGDRPGQTLIGDRHYYGKDFERSPSLRHPATPGPKSGCAGLTLYAVLRELQTLLAVMTGACHTCNRSFDDTT
jgi:hypothetical protein